MPRKPYSVLLVLVLVAMQLWFLHLTFSFHSRGIAVVYDGEEWKVSHHGYGEADILSDDRILSIDGQTVDNHPSVLRWRKIDQAREVEIVRDGKPMTIALPESPETFTYDLMPYLGEALSLFAILFIKRNMSRSLSGKHLIRVFAVVGLIFMSLNASIRGDILGKIMIGTFVPLMLVVFLHFLSTFFEEKGGTRASSRLIKTLYGLVAASTLILQLFWIPQPWVYNVYKPMTLAIVLLIASGLVVNLFYLFQMHYRYRKQNSHLSTVIKTVWFSLFLSFSPLLVFSLLPERLVGHDWIDSYITGWFVLFFPLSFTYLIASKQLYDVELLIRRALLTMVLAIAPSIIIVSINVVFFNQNLAFREMLVNFIMTLAVLTYILYSLEYLSSKLEKVMFPRKYSLQNALKKIAKDLSSITSFRELREVVLRDIVYTLQVSGAAIVFKYQGSWEIISEGFVDEAELKTIVERDNGNHPIITCVEVTKNEEYTSYILLSRKKSNTALGLEDHQWLNLIVSYLSVSLENLYLIRKLTSRLEQLAAQMPNQPAVQDFTWFRKITFELQEKERTRIANDLHDTTMQDLFFLKKKLNSLAVQSKLQIEEQEQMDSIIDYVDIINTNLRQSCFELHPHLLHEIGLVETISTLVEQESYLSNFTIDFEKSSTDIIEAHDLETKRHLFRIVQELLNNAKKHSEASRVKLGLNVFQDTLRMTYEDDGIGFDMQQGSIRLANASSGFGMEQLKSRVLYLNGQMKIEAGPGRGVKIWIFIPMKEVRTA
ncbi:ATP-binding protein [Paenibacillus koleovorans]|uniref:ATP-binding protein n=1 Tax=Paenibacillus koleovorans TaxID=121608 RepID=UPI000FD7572E|nr:ATP-binding protein [Paenibacillus koleovorans]